MPIGTNDIVGVASIPIAVPSPSSVIADLQEIPIVKHTKEDEDKNEEEDDPYEGMTDEEYLAATEYLRHIENVI